MSSEVETSRHVAFELCHWIESLASGTPSAALQLRLDKPPLTYWAQVASYHIFGENDFAARFPSTIAAALTAVLIFAWGRRMGGEKLGWWAAIIFTLSLQTFVHAK